ncbi:hypothetical protein V6N13_079451 [Hibiscus sabdariffa]
MLKIWTGKISSGGVSKFCLWSLFSFVSLSRRLVLQEVASCDEAGSVFSLRVAPSRGRSLPSKTLWRLTFDVLAFTSLGANNGTFDIVAKIPVQDPLSIQVHNVLLQPSSFISAFVLPLTRERITTQID